MDTIGTAICTAVPVRRFPKFVQEREREWLVQDYEGILAVGACVWLEKRQRPREGHVRVTTVEV